MICFLFTSLKSCELSESVVLPGVMVTGRL
uniref:Uncharacterized protein n=1 Tax=Anguilla anguilla TaxID=7936 RepID=A0A0E9UFH7_ANGAN